MQCPPPGQLGGGGRFQGAVVEAGVILRHRLWSLQWQHCLQSAGGELLLSEERSSFRHLCALHGNGRLQPLLRLGFALVWWWVFLRVVKPSSKPAGAGSRGNSFHLFWPAVPASGLYLWDFLSEYLRERREARLEDHGATSRLK